MAQCLDNVSINATRSKPKRKEKKEQRDPLATASEAARAGDERFQHFVETGKLRRSK